MKISKAETRILVAHFKQLVERDVVGITATDARNTVSDWLLAIGQDQAAKDFEHAVNKYQTSAKMVNLEREYELETR